MQGSIERVRAVVNGQMPDRAPLFDLLRNDAVIGHFAGRELTVENGPEVVYQAYAPAIDATRPMVRTPATEGTGVSEAGLGQKFYRWTSWTEHTKYSDSASYAAAKKRQCEAEEPSAWSQRNQEDLNAYLAEMAQERRKLGEVFFMPGLAGPGLMGIYGEVGFEEFSYYLADCPEMIGELLEHNTVRAVTRAEHYPEDHGIEAGFLGDDIAFNSGPLLSPKWFKEHYWSRLGRVIEAWHKKGIKILFHSDGDLNPILDELVTAGVDGINPIEVLAGMDVGDIHKRHRHLFMAGGIDVSQLLPFGTVQQVRDTVTRSIEAAEGRLMVGSSTELNNEVPLENYLALREAVLSYKY